MSGLIFDQTPFMGLLFYLDIQKVTSLKFLVFQQKERHTAENLLLEVSNIVNSSCINWVEIKFCCTDSPSTMIKFRHLLNERHKHIIVLPCALHALNLLAKDLCKIEDTMPIVKEIYMIVNVFTSSHVWFHNSKEWVKKIMAQMESASIA